MSQLRPPVPRSAYIAVNDSTLPKLLADSSRSALNFLGPVDILERPLKFQQEIIAGGANRVSSSLHVVIYRTSRTWSVHRLSIR